MEEAPKVEEVNDLIEEEEMEEEEEEEEWPPCDEGQHVPQGHRGVGGHPGVRRDLGESNEVCLELNLSFFSVHHLI